MASTGSSSDPGAFFYDDDEETMQCLVANETMADENGNNTLSSRLESLAQRFRDDHDLSKSQSRWTELMDAAKSSGFQLTEILSPSGSPSSLSSQVFPTAFQSDHGKKHLRATALLLDVSERTAVQLTMSSLRTLNETTNLQALLGTRTLLEKVMHYHFRQRSARLSAITECLRKEEEDASADNNTNVTNQNAMARSVMDSLDVEYQEGGNGRGVFRYLLSIACQKETTQSPSREQLLPAKELYCDNPSSLQESFARSSDETAWHQFLARCVNANRNRIQQERLLAMEGLVVLLYYRIQGGVRRVDYMMLLLGFQSTKSFFRAAEGKRLSQLAGLICAECMGLWRALDGNHDNNPRWVNSHPLMAGVLPGNPGASEKQAETELEALGDLIQACILEVPVGVMAPPESMALLSFSLTLTLAYDAILSSSVGIDQHGYWQLFGVNGRTMFDLASKYASLDCLSNTMEALVVSPSKGSIEDGNNNELPYEWLLAAGKETAASAMDIHQGGSEVEMDAASLVYASIGHEMLIGLVVAFEDQILSVDQEFSCENVAMVCDQASKIYRNSPGLCEPFWADWERSTTEGATPPHPPLCRVMDVAFLLVTNAAAVDEHQALSKEQLLATTAPLIQLLSTLCYNADKVEFALTALAPASIQKVFLLAASVTNDKTDVIFQQNRLRFLESFARLTRVGDTDECRECIRGALEQSACINMTGPALLLNALKIQDPKCNELVLDIVADLLKNAPVEWAWTFAHGLERLGNTRAFDHKSLTYPLSRIFNGLVACLYPVVFSGRVSDVEVEKYLTLVWSGVVCLSQQLLLCLSNVSREQLPLKTVSSILDFFATFLQSLGPISSLHASVTVQAAAGSILDAILEMLASNLGESVMYYALLPISLSVGFSIEAYAQERSILQRASTEESDSCNQYGLWRSTVAGNVSSPTKDSDAQLGIKKVVETAEIDFEMIAEKGDDSVEDFIFTSKKALILLKLWATASIPVGARKDFRFSNEEKVRIVSLSPHRLLSMVATMPQPLRTKKNVRNYWSVNPPTNLALLTRFLDVDTDSSSWPLYFPALCLDLVHASVFHARMAEPPSSASPIFNLLMKSNLLPQLITLSEKALEGSTSDEERPENMMLGILSFRLLSCSTEALARVSTVHRATDKLTVSCFELIRKVSDDLYKERERNGECLRDNESLQDDLQLATACIVFLSSQLEGKIDFSNHYDIQRATFSSLSKVILQQAHVTTKGKEGSLGANSFLFAFIAATVDFLRLSTEETNDGLMNMWQDNAIQLIAMPANFMTIKSCGDLGNAITEFSTYVSSPSSSRMVLSDPTLLMQLFPVVGIGDANVANVDISEIARLLSYDTPAEGYQEKLSAVALSHHALTSQLALVTNWRKCVDVLVGISKETRHGAASGALQSTLATVTASGSFLPSTLETVRVLRDNIVHIEQSQTSVTFLGQHEMNQMANTMAGLVLQLLAESIGHTSSLNLDLLTDSLGTVTICATKLFKLMGSNADECSHVENTLLTSAIGLLNVLESGGIVGSSVQGGATSLNSIFDRLLMTVGELFKLFQAYPGCDNRKGSIKTCVILLSVLANKSTDSNRLAGSGRSTFNLSKAFKELRILDSLVILASSSSNAESRAGTSEGIFDVPEAVVDLILVLSQTGDSGMLEILLSSGALAMLARNPLFDRSRKLWSSEDTDSLSFRGYESCPQPPSDTSRAPLFAGKDDPLHLLWRTTLKCFKTVLGASRQDPLLELSRKERFHTLVADFIVAHRLIMLACFKNLESAAFTKNSLHEATLTFSLLQEVCARPSRDRKTYELISKDVLPVAVSLVARLGSFLGASSGAREFFSEEEEEDADGNLGARQSPFNRVYNSKHEAIRYSHYASRCCRAVTSEDFTTTSSNSGKEDLRSASASASALEKKGKKRMDSQFALAMEQRAADCMFSALTLVWEMHPANSSFHCFKTSEVGQLDVLNLIKPGMVIAFCSDRESTRVRRSGPSFTYEHFAEVLYCDSLDRTWYARDLETQETEIVQEQQVVGLEDTSKRQFIMRYGPAPDSANDLETAQQSTSVGHLILALRWCARSANRTPVVPMLAGILSAMIGVEISTHTEVGSAKKQTTEELDRLGLQLLEFYGENGTASSLLSESALRCIKGQLKNQLAHAEETEDATAKSDMLMVEDGLYLRSSGRNPFQSLLATY